MTTIVNNALDTAKSVAKSVSGLDKKRIENFEKKNKKIIDDNVETIVKTICEKIHDNKSKRKLVTEDPYNAVKDRIGELFGKGGDSEKLWEYLPYFEGKSMNDNEIQGFYKNLGVDLGSNKNGKKITNDNTAAGGNITKPSNKTYGGNDTKEMVVSSGGSSDNELSKESFTDSIKIICNHINENPTSIMPLINSFNKGFKGYLDDKLDKPEFSNLINPFSKEVLTKLKNKSFTDIDIIKLFNITDGELVNKRYKIPISYFDKYNKPTIDDSNETNSILAEMKKREQQLPILIDKLKKEIETEEANKKKLSFTDRTNINKLKNLIKKLKTELYDLEKEQSTMNKINYLIKRKSDEMCLKFGKEIKQSVMNMDNGKPQTVYNNVKTEKCDITEQENETTTNFIKNIREYQLTQAELDALSKSKKGGKKSYKQKKYKNNRRKTIKYKKPRL
jgi:hypothetical protein